MSGVGGGGGVKGWDREGIELWQGFGVGKGEDRAGVECVECGRKKRELIIAGGTWIRKSWGKDVWGEI